MKIPQIPRLKKAKSGAVQVQRDKNIVQINGDYFSSGLRWVPLNSPLHYMREARAYGKKHGMDIVAIRKTERTLQAGYVKRGRNHPKVLYSLATVLAGEIKGSFFGVFEIPASDSEAEKYYLLAVKDGAIAPLSDKLFDTAEEASEAAHVLFNHYSPDDFKHIYSPSSFNLGDMPLVLSDFLKPEALKREYRVKSLTLGLSKKEQALIGIACLVGAACWYGWSEYQAVKEAERIEAARLREIERKRIEEQTQRSVGNLDLPWVKQPSFISALTTCYQRVASTPISLKGWMSADANCVVETAQTESRFVRQGNATINDFMTALTSPKNGSSFGGNVIVTGFNSLSVVSPVSGFVPGGDDAASQKVNDLTSFFQRLNVDADITLGIHKEHNDENGNPLPPPTWRFYSLSVKTEISPLILFSSEDFSGVRLQGLTVSIAPDTSKLTWEIKGVIYEK